MKQKALFVSNEIYFDPRLAEGGVRVCTLEYLHLIKELYDVDVFTVKYAVTLAYRIKVKLGINIYHDYKPEVYRESLTAAINQHNVKVVFLNLSNTAPLASVIKSTFGDSVKVILCSHGNESGDFLHEATRFQKRIPAYRTLLSAFTLGLMLKKEAGFRQQYLDAVLTVSPVEEAIEKWIGAKHVYMVPRTVASDFLERKPVAGRVGFIGDLSHWPNFFGIDEVCKALAAFPTLADVQVRIAGSPAEKGQQLAATYPFVHYLGYMNDAALKEEAATWTFFLNPVFYYSRGVSTKLAKAFGWGLPVITTSIGYRGYLWKSGLPVTGETPSAMAEAILHLSTNMESVTEKADEIKELIHSIPDIKENAIQLRRFIEAVK